VPRPRLNERLQVGLQRKLTLVSAPAGSGKSTLISAWLQDISRPTAWLSLDEGDNDPIRFLSYLLAALQTLDPDLELKAQHMLDATQIQPVETFLTTLINDLVAASEPILVVLDDYHLIDEWAIHEAVGFLLAHQPPTVHLVILTRHDPPFPVSRLRGRGQLTEIRESDLRFTPEETARFLNESMGLQLAPSQIETLEERTEGWITGLQLAALSMQGRGSEQIAQFIAGFSGRHPHVLDYLTDEVLKGLSQPVQTFLLQTSILPRMCASLCDAILQISDPVSSQQMLEQLASANLFTLPLDDQRLWYRYHGLFSELLQARLLESQPDLVPELHRRAATWFEQAGLKSDAVRHALATQDFSLAADAIQRAITQISTWSHSDASMILRWLRALPGEVLESRPWLRLFSARGLYVSGEPEVATRLLDSLETSLQGHPSVPDRGKLLALVAADRASYAAALGNYQEALEYARQALANLPADDPIARLRVPAIRGMAYLRSGDLAEARQAFSQAVDTALAAGLNFAAVPLLCNLAEVQFQQGQLQQAVETCGQARQLGTVDGQWISAAGFVGLEMGKILYEWNDLHAADAQLRESLELLTRGGISENFGSIFGVLALVKQALGEREAARAAAMQARQAAQRDGIPRLVTLASAYQVRIWLMQGQVDQAKSWARGYRRAEPPEYLREFEDLTLARCLLAQDAPEEAVALLDRLSAPAREYRRFNSLIEIQVLRAVALSSLTEPSSDCAMEALEQALALAEPNGYVRTFLDMGGPMQALLRHAGSRRIAPGYVGRLIAAFGPPRHPAPAMPKTQPLIEPLSERELEVLQLLAQRLTNQEIGQRLYISLATVKSHTSNIYGKLGVHSRQAAVSQAQALGILPPP
jgi:LuxR family maltose regulon positive regulatory protein